ncbi:MAG: reverse transcriptase/maturase family protein, partial [Spirochaetia bacterium]|nr:reverse transcriptase/maturase family protein [Spirochaetia bacterium]
KRIIQAPTFRDRVVHHAVVNVTEPLFQRKFISHNYACIKNKGSLATALQVQKYLKSHQKSKSIYVIKGDVQSYFPSISHTFLKQQIRRTIRDKNVLWFFDKIIDFYEGDFGMGIGALTSQLFAGINLTPFDHHIKDDLGIKQYVRYMDDFIIVNTDKTALKELLKYCEGYLRDVLLLTINSKSSVIPITHGVDFCGYRIFRDYMLPRKRNMKRAKKRLKKLSYLYENEDGNLEDYRNSLMSFLGYTKHCRAYYSTKSILEETAIGNCPQRRN